MSVLLEPMISPPRVSVVLSVFNGEAFLAESIESLLVQSFRDFELIVIDDGSTDRTSEILHGFDDPRVRTLRNRSNLGLTPSLNRGLSEARGEFIARQDADDVSEPDRLQRQLDFFHRNPEVVLAGSWYKEIDESGREIQEVQLPSDPLGLRWALLLYCPFAHSSVMWRKSPVQDFVGGYDERLDYATDHEFWNRIAARFPVSNVKRPLLRYRVGLPSMSAHPAMHRETMMIRTGLLADLMGWSEGSKDYERTEALFRRLFDLLYSDAMLPSPDLVQEGTAELETLHRAFARRLDLTSGEERAHLNGLKRAIAQRLIRHARIVRSEGRPDPASKFFREGIRMDPGSALTVRALRYFLRL